MKNTDKRNKMSNLEYIANGYKILINNNIRPDSILKIYNDVSHKYHDKHYNKLERIYNDRDFHMVAGYHNKQNETVYRYLRMYQSQFKKDY